MSGAGRKGRTAPNTKMHETRGRKVRSGLSVLGLRVPGTVEWPATRQALAARSGSLRLSSSSRGTKGPWPKIRIA